MRRPRGKGRIPGVPPNTVVVPPELEDDALHILDTELTETGGRWRTAPAMPGRMPGSGGSGSTPQGDGRAGRDAVPGGPTMAAPTAIRQAQRLPDGTARTRPVHLIPVGASPVPPYQ